MKYLEPPTKRRPKYVASPKDSNFHWLMKALIGLFLICMILGLSLIL